MQHATDYRKGFLPYALAAFLIGIVGGFSTVLGPAFVQDIGIAYSNTTWTALAQAVSTAACAPILGKAGDMLGRRTTLLAGIGVFALGNVSSALANSLAGMMVARFIVGVGTAAIAPVIMAYIVTQFPQHAVARGFSIYMLISSASVVFGPTLGGLINAASGWRSMLWVCVGISAVVFAACFVLTRNEVQRRVLLRGFDGAGAALVLVFFSLMLCVPAFGQNFGWGSGAFLAVLAASVLSLILLVHVEKRAEQPILPGGFIRRSAFVLPVLALFLTQGLMQANMTNTIVFVNYTQPGNSVVSGYAISVMYLGMSLGAVLLGPLADRHEPKRVLTGSLLLTGLGCASLLLFSVATPAGLLMASLGVLGFGLGANGTIFMKIVLSDLPTSQAGTGTGTYGLFRDLAAPFGVAVFVPMFTNRVTAEMARGTDSAQAAVRAVHSLGAAEIICVLAGIGVVLMLPKIHAGKGNENETQG